MAWLGTWEKRRKIEISDANVDAALSNFPLRIKISSSSGIGSTDISSIFAELGSDANRKKIAVTTTDETTECYVEIERFDFSNSIADLWVKVPAIASGATTDLYLYYDSGHADNTTYVGDTTDAVTHNVWDSSFKAVYHMAQDPNGDAADAVKDSTSNTSDGTPGGTMLTADLVDGKIGKAIDFDGTDDHIDIGDVSMDFGAGGLTLEVIFKTPDSAANRMLIGRQDDLNDHDPLMQFFVNTSGQIYFVVRGQTNPLSYITFASTGVDYDDNTLCYAAGIFDDVNNSGEIWVNSGSDGTVSSKTTTDVDFGQADLQLGRTYQGWVPNGGNYFAGIIDEVRISGTVRSAAWLKATYYSNWDELVSYGTEIIIVYGDIVVTIPLVSAEGLTGIDARDITNPSISAKGFSGVVAEPSISMPTVIMTGHDNIEHVQATAIIPTASVNIVQAEQIWGSVTIPSIVAALTERETTLVEVTLPMMTAEMASGAHANLDATISAMTADGLFSNQCEATLPIMTVEMEGIVGRVINSNISLSMVTVEMEGKTEYLINCDVSIPSIYVNAELMTGKIIIGTATIGIMEAALSSYEDITGDIDTSIAMFKTYMIGTTEVVTCTVFRHNDLPDIIGRPVIKIPMFEVSITEA